MSSIVNIASVKLLRYSALGLGVWYGFSNQQYLTKLVQTRQEEHHKHEQEMLVEEALVAYQAHEDRKTAEAAHPIVVDPDSYRYNAERWIDWAVSYNDKKEEPKKK